MEMMTRNINNCDVVLRNWTVKDAKANILFVHGYGEHSGRYEEMASLMNADGYSFYAYDRRGEGLSSGKRAYIKRFDVQVEDLIEIKKLLPSNAPIILMAHSLGGLISIKYLIDHQPKDISAMVLSAPLIKADEDMAPILQKMAGVIGTLLPFMPVVKLDTTLTSRDHNEVAKYDKDPLIFHGSTKAKTAHEILKAINYVQANYDRISIPFLVLHGGADKLADPTGSKWLYERASSSDKKIEILEGWYHEIMREPEKEKFYRVVLNWLDGKIPMFL